MNRKICIVHSDISILYIKLEIFVFQIQITLFLIEISVFKYKQRYLDLKKTDISRFNMQISPFIFLFFVWVFTRLIQITIFEIEISVVKQISLFENSIEISAFYTKTSVFQIQISVFE